MSNFADQKLTSIFLLEHKVINLAVIVPVYNEAKNLHPLLERLTKVTDTLNHISWSYIFVNDGSTDNTIDVLKKFSEINKKIKVIDFSRNFGKEIALTAGAHEAGYADAVICIDADLQHPPELIPQLVGLWVEGYEIVATIRTSTDRQPLLRRVGSRLFYWVMEKISGLQMRTQTTDYRLYDKKVIAAFSLATERERMFRGLMDWMGFKRTYVEFKADQRMMGEAGYSYGKLINLAINSITAFSLWPLKLTGYLGMLITGVSGLFLFWMLGNFLLSSRYVYTPLAIVVVSNTFLMGIVLMAVGLVALYIGNIHTEVINRPLYVVREKINFE